VQQLENTLALLSDASFAVAAAATGNLAQSNISTNGSTNTPRNLLVTTGLFFKDAGTTQPQVLVEPWNLGKSESKLLPEPSSRTQAN